MKTLVIVRHAKSSWSDPGIPDHDRPLNPRGVRDAPLMGRVLRDWDPPVDRVLSSSAVRALATADLFLEELGLPIDEVIIEEDLYHASARGILDVINVQEDSLDGLMVVGHNPGMTDLINRLSDADLENLPTSGVFILQYDVERWRDISRVLPDHYSYEYPKKYR